MAHHRLHDGLGTPGSNVALPGKALGLLAFVAGLACGDAELGCASTGSCEGDVRVATWWWDEEGQPPLFMPSLSGSLEDSTGLALSHEPSDGKATHLSQVTAAAREGQPFDAVLLNNGEDVFKLAGCYPDGDGLLRPLEGHLKGGWFSEEYVPDLIETLTCQGHVYALPLGIHRVNHVVYNRQLFLDAGISDAERASLDLPGLLDAARRIQAVFDQRGNTTASVFALPIDEPDELSLFFVENVMLAAVGLDAYRDYWLGCPGREEAFTMGLDWVAQLAAFFNRVETNTAPLERVTKGQSAMYVIGDWMMAQVTSRDTVGSMAFPGTQELWVYTADVFALPLNGDPTKGLAWLHAISQSKAQRGFARDKWAVPARLSVQGPSAIDGRLARALPAIGRTALWDVGHALQSWVTSSYGESSALTARAADEYRSRVAGYAASGAGLTSANCQSGEP